MAGDMIDERAWSPASEQGMATMSKMSQISEMMASMSDSMPPEKMNKLMTHMDEMMRELGGATDWMGEKVTGA